MEIDSKPEELDRLERRLIQLKIEREALKKEKDEASKKRLADARGAARRRSRREYADLEEIWKAEKAARAGRRARSRRSSSARKLELEAARRAGDLARMSRAPVRQDPGAREAASQAAQEAETKEPHAACATRSPTRKSPRSSRKWTGIPVSKMLEGEREKLLQMEEALGKRVVGQDEAVQDRLRRDPPLARRACPIRTGRTARSCSSAPPASARPSSRKALAEFLFDTEEAMVRIDMSEFMEKHSVARLIGAPPGYVGYEEGGYLTEAVRRRPYSVILLDEVEKAHPDVFNVLLQVLDDGRLTDGQGRTVDFRNTVIVMTSNLGSQVIQELAGEANYARDEGRGDGDRAASTSGPEFINRIDDIVVFHPLGQEQIRAIVEIQLGYLRKRLAERDIGLELDDAARDLLGEAGFDPVYGARPLKRAIQQQLENPLAQRILAGEFGPGDVIKVSARDGVLQFAKE